MTCTDGQVVHHRASRVVPNWSPICWPFLLLLGPIRSGLVRNRSIVFSATTPGAWQGLSRVGTPRRRELACVGRGCPLGELGQQRWHIQPWYHRLDEDHSVAMCGRSTQGILELTIC